MTGWVILITALFWYGLGVYAFIDCTRRDEDVTLAHWAEMLIGGLFGPVTWVVWYANEVEHGHREPLVLFKKREP